jgi:hypothetical protein
MFPTNILINEIINSGSATLITSFFFPPKLSFGPTLFSEQKQKRLIIKFVVHDVSSIIGSKHAEIQRFQMGSTHNRSNMIGE